MVDDENIQQHGTDQDTSFSTSSSFEIRTVKVSVSEEIISKEIVSDQRVDETSGGGVRGALVVGMFVFAVLAVLYRYA